MYIPAISMKGIRQKFQYIRYLLSGRQYFSQGSARSAKNWKTTAVTSSPNVVSSKTETIPKKHCGEKSINDIVCVMLHLALKSLKRLYARSPTLIISDLNIPFKVSLVGVAIYHGFFFISFEWHLFLYQINFFKDRIW